MTHGHLTRAQLEAALDRAHKRAEAGDPLGEQWVRNYTTRLARLEHEELLADLQRLVDEQAFCDWDEEFRVAFGDTGT